jgi:hypothetical protein
VYYVKSRSFDHQYGNRKSIGYYRRHETTYLKTILKAIEGNAQESRRDWILWLFKRAGEYNSSNKKYQFWQQNNHPIQMSTQQLVNQRLDYLHYNPTLARV